MFLRFFAALVGLSISYALDMTGNIFSVLVLGANVDNYMTSVERVITYSNLEPEPGYEYEAEVPDGWPTAGSIAFQNVTYHYYAGGPQILRGTYQLWLVPDFLLILLEKSICPFIWPLLSISTTNRQSILSIHSLIGPTTCLHI